jgi:hypothetical protein
LGSWYPCILSFSTSNSKLIFNLRFTKWLEPLGWRNRREKIFLGADREMLLSWSSWRLELHFLCMVEIRVFGGDFGNTTCKNGFIYSVDSTVSFLGFTEEDKFSSSRMQSDRNIVINGLSFHCSDHYLQLSFLPNNIIILVKFLSLYYSTLYLISWD